MSECAVKLGPQDHVETTGTSHPRVSKPAPSLIVKFPPLDRFGLGGCLPDRADGLQRAQAVLPDEDPGADFPQFRPPLVHSHRPTTLRKRCRRRQTGNTSSYNFSVPGLIQMRV
jgi:hypothetical protein